MVAQVVSVPVQKGDRHIVINIYLLVAAREEGKEQREKRAERREKREERRETRRGRQRSRNEAARGEPTLSGTVPPPKGRREETENQKRPPEHIHCIFTVSRDHVEKCRKVLERTFAKNLKGRGCFEEVRQADSLHIYGVS